uniref:Uncharacterized protein n=1 Tax=Arundo donax TaxID=35708 RepID=A0A0A9C524_ARUDO
MLLISLHCQTEPYFSSKPLTII